MREVIISDRESGQRLDKYLKKYLKKAGSGFIYKMLRKKNIVLNGKKAAGSELLSSGDKIKLFLSEETLETFMGLKTPADRNDALTPGPVGYKLTISEEDGRYLEYASYRVKILYEDDNVIFFDKPAGLLSQKSEKNDISLVDIFAEYMKITYGSPEGYSPGICNRLDRNTSGVIAAGKSIKGLQILSEVIRDRRVDKIYRCIVHGNVDKGARLKGYLVKDERSNKVSVLNNIKGEKMLLDQKRGQYIETEYRPIGVCSAGTILEVLLITGKTHQIRAHLASIGHPIVGDIKYGNDREKKYKRQMLHAYEMKFGEESGILSGLSTKRIIAPYPEEFLKCIK